mgnify:FL=1
MYQLNLNGFDVTILNDCYGFPKKAECELSVEQMDFFLNRYLFSNYLGKDLQCYETKELKMLIYIRKKQLYTTLKKSASSNTLETLFSMV